MSTRWVGKPFAAAFLLVLLTACLKSELPEVEQSWEVVQSLEQSRTMEFNGLF